MSPLAIMDSTSTARIGPTEHRAMRPKLFSLALRPPTVMAMPTPSAMMKGTVIGPVVTPPESNDIGRKDPLPASNSSAAMQKSSM